MSSFQILDQLQKILVIVKENERVTDNQINQIEGIIKVLREEPLNENFDGTIQEIHSFLDNLKDTKTPDELVTHHKLNLSRWIDELHFLEEGGGAVTLDYEQRKGREI
ncbi:hypothetical protein [Salisediminibacterium beveridgei]|uniref:Uncharacterized protein n=1 Tax=Salisediminibacterium beveridgei TaxID=632773 RepID=A0A1D7QT47_9BACI|nr:hypothetical protein [Salisediminibacterium beveridgei]AOM82159.1 hypothetical protein BBEV_0788 [Salisediminibacterium beveridgei]